jgi:hypothetical protein
MDGAFWGAEAVDQSGDLHQPHLTNFTNVNVSQTSTGMFAS